MIVPDHQPNIDRRGILGGATLLVALATALLLPVAYAWSIDLSLVPIGEERAGYRYFYSLRVVYAEGERPWIPQGQAASLVHMVLQVLLTMIGYPPTQVRPRMDAFVYLAAALPLVAAVAAYVWAVRPLGLLGRATVAAGQVAAAYDWRASSGYALILPDYLTWAMPYGLIALGWLLRVGRSAARPAAGNAVALGLFGGICVATKPTYLVFPLCVAILYATRAGGLTHLVSWSLAAGGVAATVFLSILFTYYLWDAAAIQHHFVISRQFLDVATANNPRTFLQWLVDVPPRWPPDFLVLAVLLPPFLAFSVLALPRRGVSLGLLAATSFAVVVAYNRSYWVTLVEIGQLAFVAWAAWGALVVGPVVGASRPAAARMLTSATFGVGVAAAAFGIWSFWTVIMPVARAGQAAERAFAPFLHESQGVTLFLIPTNEYRPGTIDSSIQKGGFVLYAGSAGWQSQYLRAMFPDRDYEVGWVRGRPRPLDVSPYDRIAFVSLPERGGRADVEALLVRDFGVDVGGLACPYEVSVPLATIVGLGAPFFSTEWAFRESIMTGCWLRWATC